VHAEVAVNQRDGSIRRPLPAQQPREAEVGREMQWRLVGIADQIWRELLDAIAYLRAVQRAELTGFSGSVIRC